MAQVQVSQQTNIDKYLRKLNEFNYNPNTNNTKITQAIEKQTKKIEEIKNIKTNIVKSTFDENIKNQYIKYLDYIINIIKAKILKDNAIMGLLNIAFGQINEVSNIINQSKDKFKKIESIEELIEIPNAPKNSSGLADDYKFPVNDELKKILNIEENNIEENNITIETLEKKIEDMLNRCAKDVGDNIKKFMKDLSNIGKNAYEISLKGGTNGTYIPGFERFNNNEKNTYINNLKSIKEAYENDLKENIQAYKKICNLLSGENGLLKNIIVSLRKIYEDSKKIESSKITKKWGLNLSVLLNKEPFKDNIDIFTEMLEQITDAKNELSNTLVQQNSQGNSKKIQEGTQVKTFIKQKEKKIEGSQPLTEGFQKFLDNLKLEDENDNNEILELYRVSLLTSLKNIKTALDESMAKDGSARTKTSSPNSYIAYAFGWNDPIGDPNNPNTYKSGKWRETEIINDGSPPTGTIELRIKLLEQRTPDNNKIDKESLIDITDDMIKLLQHEKSSAEKGSSQGTNYQEFKETQESFIPQIPSGASSSTSTGGGYKKKSKSKKMTSKKTSMKVAKKTSSKAKENKNKNKKIVKSYSKSKSKKQSGGFIRGGVLFPQDFYDTSTVM